MPATGFQHATLLISETGSAREHQYQSLGMSKPNSEKGVVLKKILL